MNSPDKYFSQILCINRDARVDRWKECVAQFAKFGMTRAVRFPAYDNIVTNGALDPVASCLETHRAVLEVIAFHRWERVLVLQDDFEVLHWDFSSRFDNSIKHAPADWELLLLGCHYGAEIKTQVNDFVVVPSDFSCLHAWGVTWRAARKLVPSFVGIHRADAQVSEAAKQFKCYAIAPMLMTQRRGYSDLELCENNSGASIVESERTVAKIPGLKL